MSPDNLNKTNFKPPQVDKLLRDNSLKDLVKSFGREIVLFFIRETIDEIKSKGGTPDDASLVQLIRQTIAGFSANSYDSVINATGVVLHTNLGRAPYSQLILDKAKNNLTRYSLLEVDPVSGDRRKREAHLETLIKVWSGADAALVVNNNAAAVYLILNTFANGREVLVSRSRLVEIGGSFRLPDIIRSSGAILKEVGTTNRTYVSDFEKNINENTALFLYVHQSNFVIKGYISDVTADEMKELSDKFSVPLVLDIGSGAPFELSEITELNEPTVMQAVKSGASLCCFSGDKLLGGCQAGIITGSKNMISKIRSNPMFRTLRPDKFTLFYLTELLKIYLSGSARSDIPVYKIIYEDMKSLAKKAEDLKNKLLQCPGIKVKVIDGQTEIGGGTSPEAKLATLLVCVSADKFTEEELARRLRLFSPPIFTRVNEGLVAMDVRTIFDDNIEIIVGAINNIIRQ